MEELRQIALDLLNDWADVSRDGIYEWSGRVTADLAELEREVADIRKHIASIT